MSFHWAVGRPTENSPTELASIAVHNGAMMTPAVDTAINLRKKRPHMHEKKYVDLNDMLVFQIYEAEGHGGWWTAEFTWRKIKL